MAPTYNMGPHMRHPMAPSTAHHTVLHMAHHTAPHTQFITADLPHTKEVLIQLVDPIPLAHHTMADIPLLMLGFTWALMSVLLMSCPNTLPTSYHQLPSHRCLLLVSF